jgi:hypothetical protein
VRRNSVSVPHPLRSQSLPWSAHLAGESEALASLHIGTVIIVVVFHGARVS